MKGRALRRALQTTDIYRIPGDVPLIVDTTELITPEVAYDMLLKNANNRPIAWAKVEEYAVIMARGGWELHAQGIVLDTDGNILTGQKRLWAVIYSGASVYMRVSRGSPKTASRLLDRGTPQSARDLASRGTGDRHSPIEASIARGVLALQGNLKPSTDELATAIETGHPVVVALLAKTAGTRKTRAALMILAAIVATTRDGGQAMTLARQTELMAERLQDELRPHSPERCWGRGAAFGLALDRARRIVEEATR